MLVLSRQRDESIVIGDMQIVFTIVDIRGGKVSIGIKADPSISIHRLEVYEAIRRHHPDEKVEAGKDANNKGKVE